MTTPADVEYPFPVVYSTESGDYRRATVAEIDRQIHAQARVSNGVAGWKADNKPDAADRTWAAYQEFVSMISRSPHGVKRTRHTSQHLRTKHAAVDTLLAVVPAGYGKRDGVISW